MSSRDAKQMAQFYTKTGDKVTNLELYEASKFSFQRLWIDDPNGKESFNLKNPVRTLRPRGETPRLMSTALHLEDYDAFFARQEKKTKKRRGSKIMAKIPRPRVKITPEEKAKLKYTHGELKKYGYKINGRTGRPARGYLNRRTAKKYIFTFTKGDDPSKPKACIIYRNYEMHSISFIHWFLFGDILANKATRNKIMQNLMREVQEKHVQNFSTSGLFLEYWSVDGIPEKNVKSENIHIVPGEAVQGNYKGRGKWKPATITATNDDGTYDLMYKINDATEQPLVRYYGKYGFELFQDSAWTAEKITELALICYPHDDPNVGRDELTFMRWTQPTRGTAATKTYMRFVELHF